MAFLAWGKRLDDRLARRWAWFDRPMPTSSRLGLILLVAFGVQFIPRLFFPDAFGGGGRLNNGFVVILGVGTLAGLALILTGLRKANRNR